MDEDATRAVAPIDTKKVRPVSATVPQPQHERAETPEKQAKSALPSPPEPEDASPVALGTPGHRTTDLAYQVDAESKRISVQVVDRDTGSVVRSFPLFMPGQGEHADAEVVADGGESDAPRGAIVDAKV